MNRDWDRVRPRERQKEKEQTNKEYMCDVFLLSILFLFLLACLLRMKKREQFGILLLLLLLSKLPSSIYFSLLSLQLALCVCVCDARIAKKSSTFSTNCFSYPIEIKSTYSAVVHSLYRIDDTIDFIIHFVWNDKLNEMKIFHILIYLIERLRDDEMSTHFVYGKYWSPNTQSNGF